MPKTKPTKKKRGPAFPLYLTVGELAVVHEAIQWRRDERMDSNTLVKIQERITDILDEISEEEGEPVQLRIPQKRITATEFQELSEPIRMLGVLAAVDIEAKIPEEARTETHKMADWLYDILSQAIRQPLERGLMELKAEIYDLTKSLRLANQERDEAWKENRKLKKKTDDVDAEFIVKDAI